MNKSSEERPMGIVALERIPAFDPVVKIRDLKVIETPYIKYQNSFIKFKRPVLGAIHHKVFHTLMRLADLKEKAEGYIGEYYFSQVKQMAGLRPNMDFQEFQSILERFKYMTITIKTETEEERRIKVSGIINSFENIKRKKGMPLKFRITFSKDFIELIKNSMLFTIPLDEMKKLHSIKDPIIYRLLTFFITQTKKQKHEVFSVLERISVLKFDTPKKRNRVFKAIKENEKILKEYGIEAQESNDGKKTYFLILKNPRKTKFKLVEDYGL